MHFEPVLRREESVAVLVVGWHEQVEPAENARAAIRMLAAETAIALERSELLAQLQTSARTDDLTGLPNRRAWEEELPKEIARARRSSSPVCVAMLDLDFFKVYNDERGHQAGDRLLKQSTAAWSGALRTSDTLARYGGEEFTVILPGTRGPDARWVAEKLRKGARRLGSELAGDAGEARVALSIGIAVHPEHGATVNDLLEAADAALYQAKREGRDRVLVAGENGLPEALGETG